MATYDLSRRDFLRTAAAVSGSFVLGFGLPEAGADTTAPAGFANAWVQIDPDNRITLLCARSEMGQGISTALPMLIAEELEVDLDQIQVAFAPVGTAYTNSLIGAQMTAASTGVRSGWTALRTAGARTRMMLVQAAAQRWGVSAGACRAERGEVVGPEGQHLTYGAVAGDAMALPVPASAPLKPLEACRLVGKPTRRLDTPAMVNGRAVFGSDVRLPGMLYAALAQCPVLGGRPVSFDASRAEAMPGVRAVVQISDGVAVVADSFWQALKARDTLIVEWNEGSAATRSTAGIRETLKRAAVPPTPPANVATAFAAAAQSLEAEYELPFLAHATMEPMNFTADVRPDGVDIYGGTQFQSGSFEDMLSAQDAAAQASGQSASRVRVHSTLMGGGFGRRLQNDFVRQAAQISRAVGRPVQLQWTHQDDIQHDYYRPMVFHTVRAALNASGDPTAWQYHYAGPYINWPVGIGTLVYAVPNLKVTSQQVNVGVRGTYWRSVGNSHHTFVIESFIDEMAHVAGRDPYEYRQALITRQPRVKAVLELAAEKAGWRQAQSGHAQGIAAMLSDDSALAMVAEVSVDEGGHVQVHRVVCAVDCGRMVNPDGVIAQVEGSVIFGLSAALYGEITLENGRVQQRSFGSYPIVRMRECPVIEVHLVSSTRAPGGIGEPGTALIMPAVANAVFQATGRRMRRLPLRPEWVKA